ncbi:MAG: hypothetical protein Q4C53_03190 [Clostridia bacterium]|nr:hypothetical protein [Clostridia bacterium]
MKKRNTVPVLAALLFCAAAVWFSYDTREIFRGTRVRNPDRYEIVFTEMNQTDTWSPVLSAGDTLQVRFDIPKGRADLEIGLPGKEPVYRGADIRSGDFVLGIAEPGEYTVTVRTRHAAGELSIRVVPEKE